jgi:hypothetical protein
VLLRLASFRCCNSHRYLPDVQDDDFTALPPAASGNAKKISRTSVAILIARMMPHRLANLLIPFSQQPPLRIVCESSRFG